MGDFSKTTLKSTEPDLIGAMFFLLYSKNVALSRLKLTIFEQKSIWVDEVALHYFKPNFLANAYCIKKPMHHYSTIKIISDKLNISLKTFSSNF